MQISAARPPGRAWVLWPWLTLLALLGPVGFGLGAAVLLSIGFLAADGGGGLSAAPLAELWQRPGLAQAAWLSVKTGVISTLCALCLTFLLVAGWHGSRAFSWLVRGLSPLLSVPHAAAALGLAFLIAPSGWMARVASPWATGWTRPPDLLILQDPGGCALILGLAVKEMPFLLLMTLAALPQAQPQARADVATSLGYGRLWGWMLTTAPAIYAQIRLPVYAVLAYGMSNVDMALILGPATPPTLSVWVVRDMADPDLAMRAPAAAAALLQAALVGLTLLTWRLGERAVARAGTARAIWGGARYTGAGDRLTRGFGLAGGAIAALVVLGGLLAHALWSVSGRWRFPQAWPEALHLRTWTRQTPEILETAGLTLALAAAVALVALILTIGCLEAEQRRDQAPRPATLWILYMPLLIPQVAFLPGIQIGLLQLGASQGIWPVALTHLVFVLPYVFLTLAGPYRAWDSRLATLGASLGAGPTRRFVTLRLAMLLRPILGALAVGMAVSVGQYLPTLLTSGGRVSTLTTEALALASGGDRRVIGAWALALTAAAWAPFGLALALPALVYKNRRGMRHG